MNPGVKRCALVSVICAVALFVQESGADSPGPPRTYASEIDTVVQAQEQALAQAKDLLQQTENPSVRTALKKAIDEMERSTAALNQAKDAPEKFPDAIAAQQAAYEALLKIIPRDFRVSRSRNGGRTGSRAGEAGREELNQLELTDEQNRYETERQATAAPTEQQREQLQIADRLKELAQRQQDLNDRLKELQTALTDARTQKEREEVHRQLKRLSDEERQMLGDMDELRQQLEQSPNANSLASTRQQLDQTRSDAERAAQEMENQSPSEALAAGSRAEQQLQNLRQDLKSQTSSRFTEQMRQMRVRARELASREDDLARGLESLGSSEHKSLDDSSPRRQLSQQMARQQSALTNLLSQMQELTEQAETTEPLLSQQLYDTLRRENQLHTEEIFEAGQQLIDRGLVSQAGEAEHAAHQNINELRQRIERAAESVLGNEADSLRFAEKQLNDLSHRLERDLPGAETNSNFESRPQNGSNSLAGAAQSLSPASATNLMADHSPRERQSGRAGQQPSDRNPQTGQNSQPARNTQAGAQRGASSQSANNSGNNAARGESTQAASAQDRGSDGGQEQNGTQRAEAAGNSRGADDLNDLVRQFGGSHGAGSLNRGEGALDHGPITGSDFVDWSSRMHDVEQVLDDQALRTQLAAAREHAAAMRAEFRQSRIKPKPDLVRRQILDPIAEVRVQVRQDLARLTSTNTLVPLDHDPVPDNYSELVRQYYERLGGGP